MVFDRVICGVDSSEPSLAAARQAARLVTEDGRLLLVAVAEVDLAVHAGFAASRVNRELRADAAQALEDAHGEIARLRLAETRLLDGAPGVALIREARRERATLVCVGTHGRRRAAGIVLGTTATALVHSAPCSVLVAREPADPAGFPATVVVGIDGSEDAQLAATHASELAGRFGAAGRMIVAVRDGAVDPDAIRATYPGVEVVDARPVPALVEAARGADLLLVGCRGRRGLRALGSVSERVAHEAGCSVLVVRSP